MMSKTKNKYSTCEVRDENGKVIGYLSKRDEENGLDTDLDLAGYRITAI